MNDIEDFEEVVVDPHYFFWIAPAGSLFALVFAYYFFAEMKRADPGSEKSQEIAGYVKEGAMAYLYSQYRIIAAYFIVVFILFGFLAFVMKVLSPWTPFAFLTGGFFSALAGYLGMVTATNASNRTAAAATKSLNQALRLAFRSGAVMGLIVVGLVLFDLSAWWLILNYVLELSKTTLKDSAFFIKDHRDITNIMLTFAMGASSTALFARVGGGIFTKAADVGADLVGKTEAGIPEDDPRNPAVIADNVGDNVGDVAGMGSDLYESYYSCIPASMALGAAAFGSSELMDYQLSAILLPVCIAGAGIFFSLIGIYFIKIEEDASQTELMAALHRGVYVASGLVAFGTIALTCLLLPEHKHVIGSVLTGLMAGIIIGWATEHYTSEDFPPTQAVAAQSTTGPATVIIEGIATGMASTAIPVITITIAIVLAYSFAGGFHNSAMGLYGIAIAAVGMLSTLGITLATDAYGPIADNAGGNAQMAGMGPEVRKRTDALDSLGNTTAATGKGFAIGSAALTVMALLGAYLEAVRLGLHRGAAFTGATIDKYVYPAADKAVPIAKATTTELMNFYEVHLMNPMVLIGVFIGSMLVFLFCAMTMRAVGRTAHKMVDEVRRQFKEIPGLLKGDPDAKPDYAACVKISTVGAQKEMIIPSLLAVVTPIVISLFFGVSGAIGLIVGGVSTGFVMAIMMANAGGTWDNAKKYVESGQFGGKGSDCHKATIVGDTVGDPFKDTSGPSLNILIKLVTQVSIIVAGLTVVYSPAIQGYLGFNPSVTHFKKSFQKSAAAQQAEYPSLTEVKKEALTTSIFDTDPVMSTGDIILPTDESIQLTQPSKPSAKPGEIKPLTTAKEEDSTPAAAFGGFDTAEDEDGADGFDSGAFSSGFDAIDSSADDAGEDATQADEPASETEPEEAAAETAPTGFGGFDGL